MARRMTGASGNAYRSAHGAGPARGRTVVRKIPRLGPEYYPGDWICDEEPGGNVDLPWRRDANASVGLMPRHGGIGSLVDVVDGILRPGWGSVAVGMIIAGGVGVVIGVLLGETEMAKSVGRGVSGVVEKGAHHATRSALAALLT